MADQLDADFGEICAWLAAHRLEAHTNRYGDTFLMPKTFRRKRSVSIQTMSAAEAKRARKAAKRLEQGK